MLLQERVPHSKTARDNTHTPLLVPCSLEPASAGAALKRPEGNGTPQCWPREEGRLGLHPASQLCGLRAGFSACQKGGRVLRPGKIYRALITRHSGSRATYELSTQPKSLILCFCKVEGVWWLGLQGVGKR